MEEIKRFIQNSLADGDCLLTNASVCQSKKLMAGKEGLSGSQNQKPRY
jgi:hypothetical protein